MFLLCKLLVTSLGLVGLFFQDDLAVWSPGAGVTTPCSFKTHHMDLPYAP